MTREEAIAELNVLHERLLNPKDCEDGCYSWGDGWYVEAIDMAIEALQREEAEEKGHCHRIRPGNVEVVVRCKDCVRKREWLVDYTHDSDWFCTLHECAMNDDDFCSYGERREP